MYSTALSVFPPAFFVLNEVLSNLDNLAVNSFSISINFSAMFPVAECSSSFSVRFMGAIRNTTYARKRRKKKYSRIQVLTTVPYDDLIWNKIHTETENRDSNFKNNHNIRYLQLFGDRTAIIVLHDGANSRNTIVTVFTIYNQDCDLVSDE